MAASQHERIKWQREVWLKEFHAPARIPQDIVLDVSMGAVERWTYVYLLCLETKSLTDSYSVTTVAHLAKNGASPERRCVAISVIWKRPAGCMKSIGPQVGAAGLMSANTSSCDIGRTLGNEMDQCQSRRMGI